MLNPLLICEACHSSSRPYNSPVQASIEARHDDCQTSDVGKWDRKKECKWWGFRLVKACKKYVMIGKVRSPLCNGKWCHWQRFRTTGPNRVIGILIHVLIIAWGRWGCTLIIIRLLWRFQFNTAWWHWKLVMETFVNSPPQNWRGQT